MLISLLFGDVFRNEGKEYIFLAQGSEHLYVAKILNRKETSWIDKSYQSELAKNKNQNFGGRTLYSYVILETKEFKNRCAHLHNTGKDTLSLNLEKLSVKLNKTDLQHIKEEITKERAISIELRELAKDIQI